MRGLGKRVELSRLQPAGNEEIPCPFRRALCQNRCLYVQEPFITQVAPRCARHTVPQDKIPQHPVSSEVHIPIFQPQILIYLHPVLGSEGRGVLYSQEFQIFHNYLNAPRHHVGVHSVLASALHHADCADHVLSAQIMRLAVGFFMVLWIKNQLYKTSPVSEVYKHQPSVITTPVNPPSHTNSGVSLHAGHCCTPVSSVTHARPSPPQTRFSATWLRFTTFSSPLRSFFNVTLLAANSSGPSISA